MTVGQVDRDQSFAKMYDTRSKILFHHAAGELHVVGDFVNGASFAPAQVDRGLTLLGQFAHCRVDFSAAIVQAGGLVERRSGRCQVLHDHAIVNGYPTTFVIVVQQTPRNPIQVRPRIAYRIRVFRLQHAEAGFLGEVVGVLGVGEA